MPGDILSNWISRRSAITENVNYFIYLLFIYLFIMYLFIIYLFIMYLFIYLICIYLFIYYVFIYLFIYQPPKWEIHTQKYMDKTRKNMDKTSSLLRVHIWRENYIQ